MKAWLQPVYRKFIVVYMDRSLCKAYENQPGRRESRVLKYPTRPGNILLHIGL
jgi:hypothetical protein